MRRILRVVAIALERACDWSHWQGEGNSKSLVEITEADLYPGGQYEFLGRNSGFKRPLTLDEALS